jgi:DNA modification methylase
VVSEVKLIKNKSLKPYKNNPRQHSKKQISQIASSIKEFGFLVPVLVDEKHRIIAGHGRLEAAKLLEIEDIPCISADYLTEAQKSAFMIADNKLTENSSWDMALLHQEFSFLEDFNFDLTLTGFETPEIDLLFQDYVEGEEDGNEPIPQPPQKPTTVLGDIWILGEHKIICGDATDSQVYEALLEDEKAEMVFTDPPYNVPVNGHICGSGKVKHDEFAMASGEMSQEEFTIFIDKFIECLKSHTTSRSLHFICMDWRHMGELIEAGKKYEELKNLCVWNKTNGGMGSLYRSKHELVFVFKNGKSPHINNIELGKNGRYRTNVWDYAGVNTLQNQDQLEMHPTVKPVSMIKDAILDCTHRNDLVLDCFGGSGSTLIAAEKAGRRALLIEIDPKYVDVTIKRFQNLTKKQVIHAVTGTIFEDVKEG